MSTLRLRLRVAVGLLAAGGIAAMQAGCQNYSTPSLDEQGKLNDAYQRGAMSKRDYDRSLRLQRAEPWGATGEPPPPRQQYTF